jgi:hypothetical protein
MKLNDVEIIHSSAQGFVNDLRNGHYLRALEFQNFIAKKYLPLVLLNFIPKL